VEEILSFNDFFPIVATAVVVVMIDNTAGRVRRAPHDSYSS